MTTANRQQRIDALRRAGWGESLIPVAVAVSLTEFGPQRDLQTQAQSEVVSNGVREESYGPFQIHLPSHPDVTKECAMDLDCSAAAALRIYNARGNFTAWSVYNNGSYFQNLEQVGGGTVIGTVPTVHTSPVQAPVVTGNPVGISTDPSANPVSASDDKFPSFTFPHFDLIKPAQIKWPGGGIDFAGVGFNTGIVFKLGATVLIFVAIFFGVIKITGVGETVERTVPVAR